MRCKIHLWWWVQGKQFGIWIQPAKETNKNPVQPYPKLRWSTQASGPAQYPTQPGRHQQSPQHKGLSDNVVSTPMWALMTSSRHYNVGSIRQGTWDCALNKITTVYRFSLIHTAPSKTIPLYPYKEFWYKVWEQCGGWGDKISHGFKVYLPFYPMGWLFHHFELWRRKFCPGRSVWKLDWMLASPLPQAIRSPERLFFLGVLLGFVGKVLFRNPGGWNIFLEEALLCVRCFHDMHYTLPFQCICFVYCVFLQIVVNMVLKSKRSWRKK